jgi:hypothetical protein
MKRLIQIFAIVGTGIIIGSVAGKFLKTEGKQMSRTLKDFIREGKFETKSTVKSNQDELEFTFI